MAHRSCLLALVRCVLGSKFVKILRFVRALLRPLASVTRLSGQNLFQSKSED